MSKEEYHKITAKEAKELLKSGKARPSKNNSAIDIPSMVLSLGVFLIIAISATVYFEYFSDTRIIKDFEPQPFASDLFADQYPETSKIPELAKKQQFQSIDSILTTFIYDVNLNEEQTRFLWLYRNELLLANHQYDVALKLSQTLQSRFAHDKTTVAPIFWYKAHAYYYLSRFRDAHDMFANIAIMNDSLYSKKASEYQAAIFELIRTDGINFFFGN